MAINTEWILNGNKEKIYPFSHSKAVMRKGKTVDATLSEIETNLTQIQSDITDIKSKSVSVSVDITNHINTLITTEDGVHGFRCDNGELQYYPSDGDTWLTIETTTNALPPMDMKSCSVEQSDEEGEDSTYITILKGEDPDDVKSDENTIIKWQGTKIVRKVGSYPTDVNDGTLVVDYQVRNQYKTTGFTDTGLIEDVTYYYRWFPYSDQGAINMSIDENVNRAIVTVDSLNTLGVIADLANNMFTRTGKAKNLSAGTDFDAYKMFGQRRRCIVADDRTILAFYGDRAYTETGKLTNSVTKNGTTYAVGTSVQVMVYQPKFYYKITPITIENNKLRKVKHQVSEVQYSGFKVHPAFVRNGVEYPYILMSAFEACTQDSDGTYVTDNYESLYEDEQIIKTFSSEKLTSIAGSKPITGAVYTGSEYPVKHALTRATARTLATNRGTGWQLQDLLMISCTQLLFLIEYATMDSQTAIGNGVNAFTPAKSSTILSTGSTSSLGNTSGTLNSGVTYRGEENLWGNIWTWLDGITVTSRKLYWADHGFADSKTTSPYTYTDYTSGTSAGYISAFNYSESCDFLFIPAECKGDSANPVGDYYYNESSSGFLTVGGSGWLIDSYNGLYNVSIQSDTQCKIEDWITGARIACIPDSSASEE